MSEFDKNDGQEVDSTETAQAVTEQDAAQATAEQDEAQIDAEQDAAQAAETLHPQRADLAASLPGFDDVDETVVQASTDATPEPMPMIPADQAKAQDKKERKPRRGLTFLLALLVLALGAYLAGVVAFMNLFMPNTTLNGTDVSLKGASDVAADSSDASGRFPFTVTGDGVDLSVTADQIKARYDSKAAVRSAINGQQAWLWPLKAFSQHELTVDYKLTYDTILLTDLVGSAVDAVNKDATTPEDASVTYNEKAALYEVKPEKLGTKLDKEAVQDKVRGALVSGEQGVELGDDELVKPEVTSDDERLNEAVNKVNAALKATQTLTTHDQTVATIDSGQLHNWVKLDDDLNVSFDKDACTKWARGELSEKLDTIGSKRSFSLPDGKQLTVEGGTYGWSIDGASIADQIAENVQAGKEATIDIPWLVTAEKWNPGGAEWGDTLIEIDLGAQHVRYFVDGKVAWESDCVSGGMNNGKMHSTPTGIYYINSNMQSGNVELRGEIDPKTNKPEYISYVKYWMPFINNSHALHDADWRSSFGGEIYKTSGSHGCVNLPPDKAKELYNMISVGTVVIVHG